MNCAMGFANCGCERVVLKLRTIRVSESFLPEILPEILAFFNDLADGLVHIQQGVVSLSGLKEVTVQPDLPRMHLNEDAAHRSRSESLRTRQQATVLLDVKISVATEENRSSATTDPRSVSHRWQGGSS